MTHNYCRNGLESYRLQRDAFDVTRDGRPVNGLCALTERDAKQLVSALNAGEDSWSVKMLDSELYQAERDE